MLRAANVAVSWSIPTLNFRDDVWQSFRSWMRSMNKEKTPSEHVVAEALRMDRPEYLLRTPMTDLLRKMILKNLDPSHAPRWLNLGRRAA